MKNFIIDFKNKWNFKGFLEAESKADAIKWFAENSDAKSRIIRIEEGNPKGLIRINELLSK